MNLRGFTTKRSLFFPEGMSACMAFPTDVIRYLFKK
jgi:hypothetical protein